MVKEVVDEKNFCSGEDFKQMAETIEDVFWITNWDKKEVLYASPAFEKIWGIKREKLYGNSETWAKVIHPEDKKKAYDSFIGLDKGKSYDQTYRIVRSDKTIKWIRDRGYPIKNQKGEFYRVIGIAQDITKMKRLEEKIIKGKDLAEKYLNLAGTIIVALNRDGEITLLNKKGYEVLGYPEGTLLGKGWFETCIPKKEVSKVRTVFGKNMNGKIPLIEKFKNVVLTKRGEERIISWTNTALWNHRKEIIGTLSSGEDVTDKERSEEELEERTRSLDKFNKFAVGRELRMIKLKEEVNGLLKELGRGAKYKIN